MRLYQRGSSLFLFIAALLTAVACTPSETQTEAPAPTLNGPALLMFYTDN